MQGVGAAAWIAADQVLHVTQLRNLRSSATTNVTCSTFQLLPSAPVCAKSLLLLWLRAAAPIVLRDWLTSCSATEVLFNPHVYAR
jgi:hypothetical protein